ncbi:hypothetical protein GS582_29970 [Rhodococcus hoagii]|nr:hypothetical protein [Prescottella equi]
MRSSGDKLSCGPFYRDINFLEGGLKGVDQASLIVATVVKAAQSAIEDIAQGPSKEVVTDPGAQNGRPEEHPILFESVRDMTDCEALPGTWSEKRLAIRHISHALKEDGVFFGATILGAGVRHNLLGRTLCDIFNSRLGGFHNSCDDKAGLVDALEASFEEVDVAVEGSTAKFIARRPHSEPDESPRTLTSVGSDLLVCPGQL